MTALITFLRTASGSSRTKTVPCSVPPVVDIFAVGSWRSMIRAADLGDPVLGHDQDRSPKRSLKRRAISRISSTCWRWSSPTGTSSAL